MRPGVTTTPGDAWRCATCGTPNTAGPGLSRCVACGRSRPVVRIEVTGRRGRGILIATWIYAVVVLAVLVLIRWVGQGWWGVTILLFLPRWLFLMPIGVLALASAWARRPSHWITHAAIALVVAGPLMGLSLPVRQLWTPTPEGDRFRVLSFNRSSRPLDTPRLIALLERERIDLICFQEGGRGDPELERYLSRGWYCKRGYFLASRHPIIAEVMPPPDDSTTEGRHGVKIHRARIRAPSGSEFLLVSVHMPTLRPGLNRFLEGDVAGLKLHIAWWNHELERLVAALSEAGSTPVLVGGDFNMPSDNSAMAALVPDFQYGFDEAGWGYGYTRPTKYPWFRIDHILASPDWIVTRCWIGPDLGSDHLPLLAEVVLPRSIRNTGEVAR